MVNGLIPVVGAIFHHQQDAVVDCILVIQFINAIGIVLQLYSHGPAQVDGFHLVQGEWDWARCVGVLLAGHEIGETSTLTQVRTDEVGCSRIGVVADIYIECQVTDLAGIFFTIITNFIIKS